MKKVVLSLSLLLASFSLFAQEEKKEEVPVDGWKRASNISLLFNQSAFNNEWTSGGTNTISADLNFNYDANLISGDWNWDNKLIANYGTAKIGEADFNKTNDRLELNSLVGKKAGGDWSYSFFANFRTQFDSGFLVVEDEKFRTSHFFSPAYLQAGPGMLWKKSDNLKVNIAPLTARGIFVHDHFTEFGDSFGVEQGDTSRFEFGAAISAYYKVTLMENITFENILNLYSNYLDNPGNIDIDYTGNLSMKVNEYISANLTLQALYDDNTVSGFQVRETLGVGFSYTFL